MKIKDIGVCDLEVVELFLVEVNGTCELAPEDPTG